MQHKKKKLSNIVNMLHLHDKLFSLSPFHFWSKGKEAWSFSSLCCECTHTTVDVGQQKFQNE